MTTTTNNFNFVTFSNNVTVVNTTPHPAIINDTIIAKSVNRSFVTADQYDRKWLLLGYNTAKETGLGRACFSGRILGLFCNAEPSKISNYILGAALQGDIQAIRNSSALCVTDDTQFVVCGKDPFKQALVDIFTEEIAAESTCWHTGIVRK